MIRKGSILALQSLILAQAFFPAIAKGGNVEENCVARIESEFARTTYGWDDKAKFELRKTKAYVVDNVPAEAEVGDLTLAKLVATADDNNVSIYTFLIKRDLCLPENDLDLEGLVRYKVAYHYSQIMAQINAPAQIKFKRQFNTFKVVQDRKAIEKEYLETKLNYDPRAKIVRHQLKLIGNKMRRTALSTGFFKLNSTPPDSESVFETVKKRFTESLKAFSGTVGRGSMWQNPAPSSVSPGTHVEINGIIDTLALLFGEKNLPAFWKERLLLETDTDVTFFDNGNTTTNQITSLKFKVGDGYVFYRDNISNFTDKTPEDCNQSTHCEKSKYKSFGFRWNALDPLKYRSNVYFEYDLIKMSGNKDFEADVISQTSAANPSWPLLRRLRVPEKENPGLLLGYIVRTGFTAQIADKVPQLIPFLKKSFGKLEITSEARLYGSTVFTDDADSLDLEFGFQFRWANQILIGLKTIYSAEIGGDTDNHFKNRRNQTTAMVFVTIPLKEPNYVDEDFADKEYNKKFEITKVELVTKKYGAEVPIHFNKDERQQRGLETGVDIAAAWGRFIYEVMLTQVNGKNTALDNQVEGYQSGRIAVKYELNPKLRIVAESNADNHDNGTFQLGLGIEVRPLAGTPLEKSVDVSISGLYYPTSGYCAVVRCNQIDFSAPSLDLNRNWAMAINVNKPFGIYKLTDWTGIKGEIGMQNRLFMRDMNFGYYSILFNAGLAHEGLGIRVGVPIYGQDFNFGAPNGTRYFSGPGEGQTGTRDQKAMYVMWDLLKFYRFFAEKNETLKKEPLLAVTTASESEKKAENSEMPKIDIENLPRRDRDNNIVYEWLAEIAGLWESGNRSSEAYELYKTVPYLVLNIAEKNLWKAKWELKHKKPRLPSIALEGLRQVYDPHQDYSTIELESDTKLESILRNTFAKHPHWKVNIQVLGKNIFSETLYCLGIAKRKTGNVSEGDKFISESQYVLPNWVTRQYNGAFDNENYCE